MLFWLIALAITLVLFAALLLCMELGRRVATKHLAQGAETTGAGLSTVEGAVFALLGLLIAFMFAGAAQRFDNRRHLIVEESNAIGTAYLRLDLLPAEAQPALRENFRKYVDARLTTYRKLPDLEAAKEEMAEAVRLQGHIWSQALSAARESGYQPAAMLLLPALNQMIDITTTRTAAARTHPPPIIFIMLLLLSLAGAVLVGYGTAGKIRSRLHKIGYAAFISITLYVIVDLDFPRLGLIRVDDFDQLLTEVRRSME